MDGRADIFALGGVLYEMLTGPRPFAGESSFSLIAYHADESGRFEAYVTAYPPGGKRWPVSSDGGVQPLWRQDGRGLYYPGLDGTLHSVELRVENDQPRFSTPTRLFYTGLLAPSATVEQYARERRRRVGPHTQARKRQRANQDRCGPQLAGTAGTCPVAVTAPWAHSAD